ncbi:PIN domain-containing protein [Kribbella sp. NPDC050124]|uniref:PIN domain-containing protein n=1 Tax=Kribbella sp. NPDC050124 TaxID=3364114 RepID=UPI0037965F96
MTESVSPNQTRPERGFLDANVIRGQLANDVLMSMAHRDVFDPRWSAHVLEEMRRNRPPGVPEAKIDRRIARMNEVFPDALTSGYEDLEPQMRADLKDRHVLAAAVQSGSDVLVTDNVKDFDPPSTGPHAMRVEKLSQFLRRKLEERPDRLLAALQEMVDRNKYAPRTLPELLDKMAQQPELRPFAQKLNAIVPPGQRGTDERLTANQRRSAKTVAFDGTPDAKDQVRPGTSPGEQAHSPRPADRDRDRDRGHEL